MPRPPRRQRTPRLDAQIRRVGLWHMPQAEIVHLRIGHGDRQRRLVRAERDAPRHIFQDDGVVVKKLMPQAQKLRVLERIALVMAAEEYGRRKADPIRLTRLGEAEIVVLKGRPRAQRYAEAGMAADAEGKLLRVRIADGIADLQLPPVQRVAHAELKMQRILPQRLFIVAQRQCHGVRALLQDGEFRRGGEAVNAHRIDLAVDPVLPAGQPPDEREQDRRAVRPVFFVAVPQKLRALGGRKLHHLRAVRIDRQAQVFILNRQHKLPPVFPADAGFLRQRRPHRKRPGAGRSRSLRRCSPTIAQRQSPRPALRRGFYKKRAGVLTQARRNGIISTAAKQSNTGALGFRLRLRVAQVPYT